MTTLPNIQTNMGGWGLRMAGQGGNQIAESMDGIISDGAVNLVQNMFDFEELQVVPVNNSAEFSRVANFTLTGRGGTNQFHGRIYYDLINSALNARNTFVPFKPSTKEHTAAAAVNGPIIRNKTFFYASYSMRRLPSKNFNNRNVPTLAMRNGDFSALNVTVRDPLTMQNGNPATGTPFPGNRIPAARFNPTAKLIQDNYIPTPNQGGPNDRNSNYGFLHPWAVDLFKWDSVTARIDHHFSEKNTIRMFWQAHSPKLALGREPATTTRSLSRTRTSSPHRWSIPSDGAGSRTISSTATPLTATLR
jgi:hypothetical protein